VVRLTQFFEPFKSGIFGMINTPQRRSCLEEVERYGRADRVRLKQAELGTPVEEVCRKMGISDATFYN
jgi:hypothetical protein